MSERFFGLKSGVGFRQAIDELTSNVMELTRVHVGGNGNIEGPAITLKSAQDFVQAVSDIFCGNGDYRWENGLLFRVGKKYQPQDEEI